MFDVFARMVRSVSEGPDARVDERRDVLQRLGELVAALARPR
jgi:hypothetical protein